MLSSKFKFEFDFETNFDTNYHVQWFKDNKLLPFYSTTIYLVAIFCLQKYMKSRPPFQLQKYLVFWNSMLAVFSTLGALRSVFFLLLGLTFFGFYNYTCITSNLVNASLFWAWLFSISKFPELGDTLFIVLRKQELIFLHWFHHVTALLGAWFSFSQPAAPTIWLSTMNYAVHAVMYSYYALRALRVKIPRWISVSITTGQILQMVAGFVICFYTYVMRARGISCDISEYLSTYLLFMYAAYLVLFGNFFHKSYVSSEHKKVK